MSRARIVALATALLVASGTGLAGPVHAADTAAETYPVPESGAFRLSGHGLGHGIGMSQFGAEGMGREGKSYRQVLDFYYPGTRLVEADSGTTLRVSLSGYTRRTAAGATVVLDPRPGLRLSAGRRVLPVPVTVKGADLASLRVVRQPDGLTVRATSRAGSVVVDRALRSVTAATAPRAGASTVAVVAPGGATRTYHGRLHVLRGSSGLLLVDEVALDQYAGAVVAHEVPSSWTATALQAQAVAARSYALLLRGIARGAGQRYDICDTSSCQTMGSIEMVSKADAAAARATSMQYLQSEGVPVLAMYSAADGGWTVAGSRPYLVAKEDPYDGVVTGAANWGHDWDRTLSAAAVSDAYPSIGSLRSLRVDGRDGNGAWGGRVTDVTLVGTSGSVHLTGDSFRWAFGLPSTWWTVTNAGTGTPSSAPAARDVRAVPLDRAVRVTWRRPDTGRDVTGYRVTLRPGPVRKVVRPRPARHRHDVTFRGLVNGVTYRSSVRALYRGDDARPAGASAVVPIASSSYFRRVTPRSVLSAHDVAPLRSGGRRLVQVAGGRPVPIAGTRAVLLRVRASGRQEGSVVAWEPGGTQARSSAATFGRRSPGVGTVVVRVDDAGRVAIGTTTAASRLEVDVLGYFTASGVRSDAFRATAATRVADSRTGLGMPQGRLSDGSTRWVRVTGRAGVPDDATSVLVTTVLSARGGAARLSTAAPGEPFASGAVSGAHDGTTTVSSALVALDDRGRVPLRLLGGPAAVAVDVLGWFASHDGSAHGRFRTADVTVLSGPAARPLRRGRVETVAVAGVSGIPSDARSVLLSIRGCAVRTHGTLSVRPAGSSVHRRPALAFDTRRPSRNLVAVPVGRGGRVEVAVLGDDAEVTVRVVGWYS